MGVSKAILNNVIFCHQEDSNWPLTEKTKVKQKFDDLFCASRYNKALQEIKDQKKKLNQEVRETKIKLEGIRQRKDQADQFTEDLKNYESELQKANVQLEQFKEEIEKENKTLEHCNNVENQAREAIKKIDHLKSTKQVYVKKNAETEKKLKEEYLESDEELESLQKNFANEISKLEQSKIENEKSLNPLKLQKIKANQVLQRYDGEYRDFESKLKNAQQNYKTRDENIKKFLKEHEEYSFDIQITLKDGTFFDLNVIDEFLNQTSNQLDLLTKEIQKIREENKNKSDIYSKQSGTITSEIGSIQSNINRNQKKLSENQKIINQHKKQIDLNTNLISQIENLEKSVTKTEEELSKYQEEQKTNAYEQQITNLSSEKDETEKQSQKISKLISTLTKHTAILSKIEATENSGNQMKSEILQKIQKLQNDCKDDIDEFQSINVENIIFIDNNPNEIKKIIENQIKKQKDLLKQFEQTLNQKRKEFSSSSGKLSANVEQLKKLEKNYQLHHDKISKYSKSIPDLILDTEKTIQQRQRDITMAKSAEIIYKNFIDQGNKQKNCPLCERGMEEDLLSELMNKLTITLQKVPERLNDNRIALKEAENEKKQLQKLLPNYNESERLSKEIPNLKQNQEELKIQTNQIEIELKECENQTKEKSNLLQNLQKYQSNINDIINEYNRYHKLILDIEKMKSQIPNSNHIENLTLDQANEKYENLMNKNKKLSNELIELRKKEKNCQLKITNLLNSMNETKSKLLKATNSAQEIENLRKKLDDLNNENNDLNQQIQNDQDEFKLKKASLDEIKKSHQNEMKIIENNENNAQKIRDQFNSSLLSVKNSIQQTKNLSIEDIEKSLLLKKEKKDKAQDLLNETDKQILQQEELLKKLDKKLSESEVAKRNLNDYLEFRKQKKEIDEITEKIKKLESSYSTPPQSILTNKLNCEKKLKLLHTKYDSLFGTRNVYSAQASKIASDLTKPAYKNITNEYKEMLITLNSAVMAIEDLDRYYHALDKAIMQYHAMKIEEINKILKELWQSTYKGSDIDCIELRADNEGARSYNYRLIMVKGDSELDMRGRCSAGQKVLASLVIRLALAESLGVNCGIIALDEPTTNLDRENVESFASALVEFVLFSFLFFPIY